MDTKQRLQKVKMYYIRHFTAMGKLMTRLKLTENMEIETMATNGTEVLYNNEFAESLNDEMLKFVYLHEIMHVIYNHMTLKRDKNPMLWNIATDYCINTFLIDTLNPSKNVFKDEEIDKKNMLYDSKYTGMSAVEIYNKLLSEAKQNGQSYGNGDLESAIDDFVEQNGQGMSKEEKEQLKKAIKEVMEGHKQWEEVSKNPQKQAEINSMLKAIGTMFGGTVIQPEIIEKRKDWREILSEFLTKGGWDYMIKRPNKRTQHITNFFLPNIQDTIDGIEDIWCFIDTSGSMLDRDVVEVLSCLSSMQENLSRFTARIIGFDTDIHNVYKITEYDEIKKSNINFEGRGGTDFQAVFDYIEKEYESPEKILICTDGYAYKPDRKGYNNGLAWLFTDNSTKEVVEEDDLVIEIRDDI
jgi:predicted metal-dependent peptidase